MFYYLPSDLQYLLLKHTRYYETEMIMCPDINLGKHYTALIGFNEIRLLKIINSEYSPVDSYLLSEAIVRSGSPDMIEYMFECFKPSRLIPYYLMVGELGYLHLLDALAKHSMPDDSESKRIIENGFRTIIERDKYNITIRVFMVLHKHGYIEQWNLSLLSAHPQVLKVFREHLGPYPEASYMYIKWSSQTDESIRYIFLDEHGLQGTMDPFSMEFLVGETRLSNGLVEELIKKYMPTKYRAITVSDDTTEEQIIARKCLLRRYNLGAWVLD